MLSVETMPQSTIAQNIQAKKAMAKPMPIGPSERNVARIKMTQPISNASPASAMIGVISVKFKITQW